MLRLVIHNYQRPENVKKIVFSLWKLFPKITVINNNPNYSLPYWGGEIDVINNNKNYFCMERWIRCFEYPEEYKLIIDDDILPIIVSYLIKRRFQTPLKLTQGRFMFLPEGDVGLNKSKEHFTKRWNVIKKFQNIGWTD